MAGQTNFPGDYDAFGDVTNNVDDVDADHINDLRRAVEALQEKVGHTSDTETTTLDYKVNKFFTAGRKLYLYENSAPTGWSIAAVTDRVLAVKGGSQAYNVSGGNEAGSWDSADGLTCANHNHQWWNYIDMNTHDQTYNSSGTAVDVSRIGMGSGSDNHLYIAQDAYGINIDGYTDNEQPAISSDSTWRPYAAVGIIITKS